MSTCNRKPAAILAALLLAACSEQPAGIAITNVDVIDAVNGRRPAHTVIFDGDEIVAVLPASADLPAVEQTIDGSGKFLIPGLWDMHVHLTYDDRFTPTMPETFLGWGITSVRDTGGLMHKMKPVVGRMREPGAIAPRVFFSGPLMDGGLVVYDGESRPEIGTSNPAPDEARAKVAELASQGVDFLKIYELVSPEVFAALVEAAGEHGLPLAAHVPLSMTASSAGPSVGSMEHLRNIELDCAANAPELLEARTAYMARYVPGSGFDLRSSLHSLQRLPAIAVHDDTRCDGVLLTLRGTVQVPTARLNTMELIRPYERDDWLSALRTAPADAREEWRAWGEQHRGNETADTRFAAWTLRTIARLHERGVPVGAGTDTPIGYAIPGYSLHNELDVLVRAGLEPLDAIAAATVVPARFFGLEAELGTIAPGMHADLLLLDADPLADITNTRRIDTVISRGRVFAPEELLSQ